MCRIVGLIRTSDSADLPGWYHLVGAPNSLRAQAVTGCVPPNSESGHDDSWGVGWFDNAGEVSLLRQTGSAADSAYFVFASETAARGGAGSGPARTILGHLRKASVGNVTSDNAHPVRVDYRRSEYSLPPRPYDTLLVTHNGTIKQPLLDLLRSDLEETERAEAHADSDTVVLSGWLAAHLDAATGTDTFDTLSAALQELFVKAKSVAVDGDLTTVYTGINLVLAHPTGLYTLRQFSHNGEYYTLSVRPLKADTEDGVSGFVVASEHTDEAEGWELLEPGVLTCFAPDGTIRRATVA